MTDKLTAEDVLRHLLDGPDGMSDADAIALINRYAAQCVAEATPWIATTDRLPKKPGIVGYEHVDCLIVYNGSPMFRPWNCEHNCWDSEDYDDYFCDPTEPTHWMPFPDLPKVQS